MTILKKAVVTLTALVTVPLLWFVTATAFEVASMKKCQRTAGTISWECNSWYDQCVLIKGCVFREYWPAQRVRMENERYQFAADYKHLTSEQQARIYHERAMNILRKYKLEQLREQAASGRN